ncbi:MAG: hypothetical protein ACREFY_09685 [Acetobacteraceae bacterium]
MFWGRTSSPPCRPLRYAGGAAWLVGVIAGCVLLVLASCAAPATGPNTAASAANGPPGYAPQQEVRVVSEALNQKLDHMLATMTIPPGH